ncbi:MAG: Asd/ArgC dimerization domain-containing protein [Calditrichia bacterium]
MREKKSYNVAVVGATGLVGQKMIQVLEEREFPVNRLVPVASERSAENKIYFRGEEIRVQVLDAEVFREVDISLFSAGAAVSLDYAPVSAESGAVVIDNSSAWRMDPAIPLVVPEVNPDAMKNHNGIIANPNCSIIQLRTGDSAEPFYPHHIANNCLPHIDVFNSNGYTKEEMKMIFETRKIMGLPELAITATTVRVPVKTGHSESVNLEFEHPFELEEIYRLLKEAPGIVVQDEPDKNSYPMPILAEDRDEVFVGRIRRDESIKNGLNLWIVADNLRKGAATNAVQIAELLVRQNLLQRN